MRGARPRALASQLLCSADIANQREEEPMTPRQSRLLAVFPAVLILALVFHFGMTLIYLSPLNPPKAKSLGFVRSYMEPLFWQRWELFAPNPIMDNRYTLVSCRLDDGAGGHEDTAFYDLTTPLLEAKYRWRFTPADRLERAAKAASYLAMGTPDPLLDKIKQHADVFSDFLVATKEAENARREKGLHMFARLASAQCDALYGRRRTSAVRIQYVIVKPPPFSRRRDADQTGESTVVEFPWLPYEEVAAL
jgi:hypothetical protein